MTTEPKWTPGTWTVTTEHYAGRDRLFPVWKVNATTAKGGVIGVAVQPVMSNEDTAPFDARLIAAAPDMAEALQDVFDSFRSQMPTEQFERVRSALAKARGDQ